MDNLLRLRYLRHRQTPIYLKLVKAHAIRRELPLQSLIESVNFADFQIARIKKWIFILYVLFIFLSALRQSVLWVIHYVRILLVYSFFAITGQRYCFFVKPPNFSVLFFSQSKEHLCFRRGKQHTCCMPSTYAHVRIWQTQERYQPGKKKGGPQPCTGLQSPSSKVAASYSPALHCSTIGAGGLNFSVRNGKRWNPAAIAT